MRDGPVAIDFDDPSHAAFGDHGPAICQPRERMNVDPLAGVAVHLGGVVGPDDLFIEGDFGELRPTVVNAPTDQPCNGWLGSDASPPPGRKTIDAPGSIPDTHRQMAGAVNAWGCPYGAPLNSSIAAFNSSISVCWDLKT